MVLKNIQHPSPYWPAVQVDTTVRSAFVASCDGLLIQFVDIGAGFPARPGPHCAQCSVTSGIMLARNLKAVDRVTQCRRGCCDDAGRKYVGYEARLGRSGSLRGRASPSSTCGGYSAEFSCPPPSQSYFGYSPFV